MTRVLLDGLAYGVVLAVFGGLLYGVGFFLAHNPVVAAGVALVGVVSWAVCRVLKL